MIIGILSTCQEGLTSSMESELSTFLSPCSLGRQSKSMPAEAAERFQGQQHYHSLDETDIQITDYWIWVVVFILRQLGAIIWSKYKSAASAKLALKRKKNNKIFFDWKRTKSNYEVPWMHLGLIALSYHFYWELTNYQSSFSSLNTGTDTKGFNNKNKKNKYRNADLLCRFQHFL